LRKARANSDCDNIEAYEASEYGTFDTKRRYPELTAFQVKSCKDPKLALNDLNRLSGIFFTGGDQAKHKASFINADGSDTAEMKLIR